ncbi:DUF434 domain-containing protein [Pseudofulvibacter geojedonensis]|uniref:DUF434 domain-containing protein n=1 Tax=Pseudofulvibacter geojedonensis TaxID=1123758 RepID=A0ABW3I152_9FLAO
MTTRNRGKEGSDDRLFGDPKMQKKLKEATQDMCYLLTRGFAEKSSVQLVGNRYRLNVRQQKALMGMSAGKQYLELRKAKELHTNELKNKTVLIDGFNLLITLESALSGAYLFKGVDGNYRDVSSVHGTYKRVQKTNDALQIIGKILMQLGVSKVHWYFDQPVSNSGKLKTQLRELAEQKNYPWEISLDHNPDKVLAASQEIVISSDAWILNECQQWFNLCGYIIENCIEESNIVSAV